MLALSLTQPWATLVAIGAKRIETRSWSTAYRGSVAIHAAKAFPEDDRWLCDRYPYRDALRVGGYARPTFTLSDGNVQPDLGLGTRFWGRVLARGAIVAVGELVDCIRFKETTEAWARGRSQAGSLPPHEADFGDFAAGRFGFLLAEVRSLPEPIPCRGALGLWEVPADVLSRLKAHVGWDAVASR